MNDIPALFTGLLTEWGEGLLRCQIHDPSDPARHGAFHCPACARLHGRCIDAVHPFLHLARKTGNRHYIDAARALFAWAETNTSQADGSWTVVPDPDTWRGITIFNAIALAETLRHHGDILDTTTQSAWMNRLSAAAAYVHRTFVIGFTNINYPAVATYGLHLFGELLNKPAYAQRARELANDVVPYFSTPGCLLIGEGKPFNALSPRGMPAVDLGYNVEESLVMLAAYARETGDRDLEDKLIQAWRSHLSFMLPDGAWDNSWGTRHAKWSYWGSRTSEGAQYGLALLSDRDPAFATAAIRNTALMRACTHDGLLHGGPHYRSAGMAPCVHHTFAHAKAITAVLDQPGLADRLHEHAPLPRATQDGVLTYPEIAVHLAARGSWRATVSCYDFLYRADVRQPTGGVISMLWHRAVGPICAGSMPRYVKVEPFNMQDHRVTDGASTTPGVECRVGDKWYAQAFDLQVSVMTHDDGQRLTLRGETTLHDESGTPLADARAAFVYRISAEEFCWQMRWLGSPRPEARLVLPLICRRDETVLMRGPQNIGLSRRGGQIVITSNTDTLVPTPLHIRGFNLIPGFETVALSWAFSDAPAGEITVHLRVEDDGSS